MKQTLTAVCAVDGSGSCGHGKRKDQSDDVWTQRYVWYVWSYLYTLPNK